MVALFRADLADGSSYRESDGTWDGAPHGVRRLSVYDAETGREWAALESAPGRRFWFLNEGRAVVGSPYGLLSAKIIGAADGETATEMRLDLLDGPPRVTTRTVRLDDLRLSESALRAAG